MGIPFGDSTYLRAILSGLGLPLDNLFLGYVSTKKAWKGTQGINSEAVQTGIANLATDLAKFKPNCCLLLGDLAYRVFGGENSIYVARGAQFFSPTFRVKCIGTYDPAEVMRNYVWNGIFRSDCNKAKTESLTAGYTPPIRQLESWPTFERLCTLLESVIERKPPITFDLEGWPNAQGVTCYSIAESPKHAFIVPFRNMDNSGFWNADQELRLWQLTARILSDPEIEKTAHNSMYELFVFAWRHKILVRGLKDDTMFKVWEAFCEYPKNLGFVSSLTTDEPYYKDERTDPDLSVHHEYCCKDSVVTAEANQKLDSLIQHPPSRKHYEFNIKVTKPYLYMQLRGCKLDLDRLREKKAECWSRIQHQQSIVNDMCGEVLNVKSSPQKAKFLYEVLGLPPQKKRDPKTGVEKLTTDMDALAKLYVGSGTPAVLEIAKLVRLRTRFSDLHKLAPFHDGRIRCNYNPVGTDTGRLSSSSTSIEAIITEAKIEFKKRKTGVVMDLKYKQVVDYLGTNLQNVTKDIRDLFIPESEDFSFFQYDLSGADAWTVACDLAALGNERMLVHLRAGIKPSVVILLLVDYGNEVYKWDIEKLKQVHDAKLKVLKSKDCPGKMKNAYTASKKCQHGTNYGMQVTLLCSLMLKDELTGWIDKFNSGASVEDLDIKVFQKHHMQRLQNAYSEYYGLELRSEYIRRQLSNHGYIDSANGHRRYFTGIRSRKLIDDSIVRTAAAHEPQANTTFATNAALVNLYYDLENRTPRGNLRAEPTLMIHDALAGQAHKSQVDWARNKFENEWFNIPLTIHGIDLSIPVEGGWGPNWKDTD